MCGFGSDPNPTQTTNQNKLLAALSSNEPGIGHDAPSHFPEIGTPMRKELAGAVYEIAEKGDGIRGSGTPVQSTRTQKRIPWFAPLLRQSPMGTLGIIGYIKKTSAPAACP